MSMLLFSYFFTHCQAFYFLLLTSEIEPTFFQTVCLGDFHPIVQVMVYFTQKDKLYIFARKKRAVQLSEKAYLKK